jgi:hypothetical protein
LQNTRTESKKKGERRGREEVEEEKKDAPMPEQHASNPLNIAAVGDVTRPPSLLFPQVLMQAPS